MRFVLVFVLVVCTALVLTACGDDPDGRLRVPLSLAPGTSVPYALAWCQETDVGDSDHGTLSWNAWLDVAPADTATGGDRRFVVRILPDGGGDATGSFSFGAAADGTIHAVEGFSPPSGYRVKAGDVGSADLMDGEDWVRAFLRPLPPGPIEADAHWPLHVALDGLPMPLVVELDARVVASDAARVVVEATGEVVVPQVPEVARGTADQVRAATRRAHARYVVSRTDGLVESMELVMELSSASRWRLGEPPSDEGPPLVSRNVTRLARR